MFLRRPHIFKPGHVVVRSGDKPPATLYVCAVRRVPRPSQRTYRADQHRSEVSETQIALTQARSQWRRFAPLVLLAVGLAVVLMSGVQAGFGFDALALHYRSLADWVAAQPALATLLAFVVYALATAVSFPAAWLLTVMLGLLFGWFWAALVVVFGATAGAVGIFLATRLAFADFFRARADGWVRMLADGFRRDAFAYMLFLRFVPAVPFVIVNVVPAIVGVPLRTYALTTLIGIVPGVFVYAFAGEGLRSIIADRAAACAVNAPPCGTPLDATSLITPEIIAALALLALLSLMPVVVRHLQGHKA